jgi:hypothetical protein
VSSLLVFRTDLCELVNLCQLFLLAFDVNQNNFKRLLETEANPSKRAMLVGLLAEQEAELKKGADETLARLPPRVPLPLGRTG